MWSPGLAHLSESQKIRFDIVPYTRGRGLDLGCGYEKPFPHFIGVDNDSDHDRFKSPNHAICDIKVPTCEKLDIFQSASMDFVFSSHLLEHIVDTKAALREWWRVVKPGGHLVLYLPHKDFYPNIGQPGSNPDHKHDFLPQDIVDVMKEVAPRWDLLVNEERNQDEEYSFLQVFRKTTMGSHVESWKNPKPEKTCCLVRYGAYGDIMQSMSVVPGLKRQGYHVTLYTVTRAYEAVANDPNIDAFVVQDSEQVPNAWLGAFFEWLTKRYDKFVNLSGTVEDHLLPNRDRVHFYWPHEIRHERCNKNYIELQHQIAEVPYTGIEGRFYPTLDEKAWAQTQRQRCKGPVICWSLSGSAPHKVWHGVDHVIASIMVCIPNATVVLMGGPNETPLGYSWVNEPRVWNVAGTWSIRQALAFAQKADLVIGPETGVLNAMAIEEVAKVIFLSHSSVENLCRDWRKTIALAGEAKCYPCHRLHTTGWEFCSRIEGDGGGMAECQELITVDAVWKAVRMVMEQVTGEEIPEYVEPERRIANA